MPMPDKAFFDTNVVIYFYSSDEIHKQERALALLDSGSDNIISTQVINELTNVLFKKFKLTASEIENVALEIDTNLTITDFNFKTQIKAIRLKEKYGFQYYDSLIMATALEEGCSILYSEDLQHGQVIENTLTVLNPFV